MLLRHIRYFLAVAEYRNFTRAAEALHVSQPTLSQQIRQLEDALSAQLLDRSGRTIQLTDAGAAYLLYAQRALQDLEAGERAIHDVRDLTRGSLRLAMTPTFTAYLIGPLLQAYNHRYPNITLNIREMPQERMEALLNEDALDVGIAFSDTHSPDIETQALFVEALAMVIGKSHPYAKKGGALTLREFEREALVLLNEEFATRHYIDRYCRQHGVAPRIAMEVNSISAVIELVRRSTLATLLPAAIAREHRELCLVELEPALPQRTAALLLRKGAYRSAATSAFIALALDPALNRKPLRADNATT
ncbi:MULTISPECIES: transcriptional regulator CynR [Caballeronia]|uniref:transcriptional regulator CynR n=1 Tax=Caballeronia TaxID=1827195 RepID=UPI0002388E95|nr:MULTISPECIES: transcriptional regulator CynR [unclassified Caballeronia]AET88608.1 DNA-binding transcriptional regulator CynR [Burkholderia sp. YI23]MCE4542446.1 transcriptional regulator CynR [Caballeronia sp. PC1]MCE4568499.1 transcriptional regulator CynR [Caballeronia sp. CLC5]BAO85823.1 DNA-binding transcriptional regulator CynR [Burkholderia sp. RPE67]